MNRFILDPFLKNEWFLNDATLITVYPYTLTPDNYISYNLIRKKFHNVNPEDLQDKIVNVYIDSEARLEVTLEGENSSGVKTKAKVLSIDRTKNLYIFRMTSDVYNALTVRVYNYTNSPAVINKVAGTLGFENTDLDKIDFWFIPRHLVVESLNSDLITNDTLNNQTINNTGNINNLNGTITTLDLLVNRDVTIIGNLEVLGNRVRMETETIQSEDNNIELNYGGNPTTSHNAGITVLNSGNAYDPSMKWDNTNKTWVYEGQEIGRVPLGAVVYAFDISQVPALGVVSKEGFMVANGVTVPVGYKKAGWVTPDLTSGYIQGGLTIDFTGAGSDTKTISIGELPIHSHPIPHSHSISGGGGGGTFVDDVFLAIDNSAPLGFGAYVPPGYSPVTSAGEGAYADGLMDNIVRDQNPDVQDLSTRSSYRISQRKSTISVSIPTGTGGPSTPNSSTTGGGQSFDLRSFHKTGIPLVRVH